MISCTEFIPAYSEGFKFLEEKGGKDTVIDFWNYLSDIYLEETLKKEVIENGIKGCFNYWSHSLNEEAADFTMTLDEKKGSFIIKMHHCPSKGMLNELKYMDAYKDYCEHCKFLYARVLEPLGYEYIFDDTHCDNASCELRVNKK